ncbi:putative peptidoglycan glycosyltransferase FtsW [Actinomyces viscosus]|uniref:peptidoglycan glycosyltransferase FtsW n=1 Tax=Actinomyces viscosus TaxID=1656 RepID=UPI0028EF58D1|nr:putative peptidoglycan glycosyltransferase FtsW [Actinomyces viscosus]
MKTGSASATAPRSSTPSSSGSSAASGRAAQTPRGDHAPDRAAAGKASAGSSGQSTKQQRQQARSGKRPGSRSAQPRQSSGGSPRRQTGGPSSQTSSPGSPRGAGARTTGRFAGLSAAWGTRLARWGARLSRPWEGTASTGSGAAASRERRGGRADGAADAAQGAEQVTLTYYCLLISTLVLETFGLIMVFSVQSVTVAANGGNAFTDFAKYLIFAVVGTLGMVGVSRMPLSWFPRVSWVVLALTIAMQCLVFTPIGVNVYGNRNWILVPGVGTAQPSEFIKVALALVLGTLVTWYVAKRRDRRWYTGWAGVGIAIMSVLGGQDLGTVIILVLIVAGALWVGGLRKRWFALLGALGMLLFAAASMLSANRRARIIAWIHPEGADPTGVGYQPKHGMWALGTGGWFGVGPGSSRQKWGYLTQADSDYIFAVLGEEFGLVGTLVVIALFAAVGACCLRLMRRHTSTYVVATTSAIGAWIVGQAIINMGVVTGALPVLGVPLPLVSRGGTALVSVLLAIGVLLAFARHEPGAQEALSTSPGALRRSLAVIVPRRNRARDK